MLFFFFFNDTATTEIYTLSLHDALPICEDLGQAGPGADRRVDVDDLGPVGEPDGEHPLGQGERSEEHTSELQSRENLVCRLLLEKKKKKESQLGTCKKNSSTLFHDRVTA